jgi:NADH:ubiquinone oxidoreductase subunit H
VAGFNVEYSSLLFAFFFLAEYSSMGFFGALLVTLFFGGYSLPGLATATPALLVGGLAPTPLAGEQSWSLLLPALGHCSGEALLLALKVQLVCMAFIGVRASLPRKRFDQLVLLC